MKALEPRSGDAVVVTKEMLIIERGSALGHLLLRCLVGEEDGTAQVLREKEEDQDLRSTEEDTLRRRDTGQIIPKSLHTIEELQELVGFLMAEALGTLLPS